MDEQHKPAFTEEHVFKRGQEMWEDKDGFHKILAKPEDIPEPTIPEYLQLHDKILEGGDPYTTKVDPPKPTPEVTHSEVSHPELANEEVH